jgi:hypothetical protein
MNVKFRNNTSKWQMEFNSAFKGLMNKVPRDLKIFVNLHLLAYHVSVENYIYFILYIFFWVILRRLKFICRRFGTPCSIFIGM